tara:strand:- start:3807 stop:4613 length:807 start_codon:yes stop_codon:yes gene_type:complete
MDIGTAKPAPSVLERTPHGLINIRDVQRPYSAADFRTDAQELISESRSRGRIPLCVGGTLFYFSALLHGLSDLPPADAPLRATLEEEATAIGWQGLYERLHRLAPDAARQIAPEDRQRILRALEIHMLAGGAGKAATRIGGLMGSNVRVLKLCLFFSDRAVLHERISQRFKLMLEQGFLEEVEDLKSAFPDARQTPAMRSVGYQQAWGFLQGETSREQFEEDVQTATRRLAKRQLTWLRNEPGWIWFDALNPRVLEGISRFLAAAGCR